MIRTVPVVIVGSGVAGLTAALTVGNATVLTRGELGSGSTRWAQGGIAAALGADDAPAVHAADTLAVSGGLGDRVMAGLVASSARDRIRWLLELGARFDRSADGSIELGREAGHSRDRIVHASGDATGKELTRALRTAVRARADIDVVEDCVAVDLLRHRGSVAGVMTIDARGQPTAWIAGSIVLATGGLGGLYARTTNPGLAAGEGLAMALRAGVRVGDLEFVQFHPTALDAGTDPMPLLTEALRGAGATLVDETGRRYLLDAHPDAELAPRDIVARATWRLIESGGRAYLDATRIVDLSDRFPTALESASSVELDARTDLLPISPAAHYHMGGITTDACGRTNAAGLWACGEVATTGLHGANRLASNSLLEGLVMGARVAADIARSDRTPPPLSEVETPERSLAPRKSDEILKAVRALMWEHVGLVRSAWGLSQARAELRALAAEAEGAEDAASVTAADAVARSALHRTESRGSHFRSDHPQQAKRWRTHSSRLERPVPAGPLLEILEP